MVVQKIKFNLTQNKLDDVRIVQGDTCRKIIFEASDIDGVLSPEDYTYMFQMVKPDHTFIIQTLTDATLKVTEQMGAITGTSYYGIRITDINDELIYSGQGAFIVDDHVISDSDIESVAEVNGYVFPDDFATTEEIEEVVEEVAQTLGFAKIADNHQNLTETWSSEKIANYAEVMADGLIADNQIALDHTWSSSKIDYELTGKAMIDDESTSSTNTWSSSKISDEIDDHTEINDNASSTTSTWSSDKIADEIAGLIDDNSETTTTTWSSDKIADEIASAGGGSSDDYTTTEAEIGTWLGTPLYRRVIEISGVKQPGSSYTLLNDGTINLIKYEGIVQNQYWTGAGCMLNSYFNSGHYCGCSYSSNDGARIDWYNNLNMAISKIYLIIYYTKK